MTVPNWALRAVAALAAVAGASRADAQQPNAQRPQPGVTFPQTGGVAIPAAMVTPRPAFDWGPLTNPALNNPFLFQTNVVPVAVNPWAVNRVGPGPFVGTFANPFAPVVTATPPVAYRQPGQLFYKGPDLQVNPTSGLVYRPLSGVAQTADGSVFYRVPGSGLPTAAGTYAPGTGLYYDPQRNTFLNPRSGVISRPGVTNVFLPWQP